ncbi:hypothetical protein P344_04235 [Spiroplasma mirum ATCC 29335]|uniref:Uncharacterized protein n=1 Tax=Spiroplasma mirum ATCC 29335 TaxID=838561 RepID=W0GR76_9MOLU|nr:MULTISPECIES: hypothetical protein [Spiroplasma]AHF61124.1 hypothetical protein SMM_0706 [Spiroplasma mirum ATCC 29335]AHI58173.1 hypothetical protein P344_04235 [Spiroplasma mirum ATCC 29335]
MNSFCLTITINTPTSNLVVLVSKQNPSALLQHNEVLGYLLNELRLELSVFGDLYVTYEMIALSCLTKVTNVLTIQPLVINNQVVTFQPTTDQITINYQFDEFSKNVKSLRLALMRLLVLFVIFRGIMSKPWSKKIMFLLIFPRSTPRHF